MKNNLITAARGMLVFLVIGILFGFLWSGGELRSEEYALWALILVVCVHAIYVNNPARPIKVDKMHCLASTFGLLVFALGIVLNLLGIVRSPDLFMLALILAPVTVTYIAQRGFKKARFKGSE